LFFFFFFFFFFSLELGLATWAQVEKRRERAEENRCDQQEALAKTDP